jgi:hypothetical protein
VSGFGFAIERPPTEHANPLRESIINWTVTGPRPPRRARAAALPLLPAYFALSPELDTRKRDQEAHFKASRYRDSYCFSLNCASSSAQ